MNAKGLGLAEGAVVCGTMCLGTRVYGPVGEVLWLYLAGSQQL